MKAQGSKRVAGPERQAEIFLPAARGSAVSASRVERLASLASGTVRHAQAHATDRVSEDKRNMAASFLPDRSTGWKSGETGSREVDVTRTGRPFCAALLSGQPPRARRVRGRKPCTSARAGLRLTACCSFQDRDPRRGPAWATSAFPYGLTAALLLASLGNCACRRGLAQLGEPGPRESGRCQGPEPQHSGRTPGLITKPSAVVPHDPRRAWSSGKSGRPAPRLVPRRSSAEPAAATVPPGSRPPLRPPAARRRPGRF